MKKSLEEFLAFYANAPKNGVTLSDKPLFSDIQIENILSGFFQEPVFRLPEYQFRNGSDIEISQKLISEFEFEGVLPKYKITNGVCDFEKYELLFHEEGFICYIINDWVDFYSTVSMMNKACSIWQSLIDNFKIVNDEQYISNFGSIHVDTFKKTLKISSYEDIPLQDTRLVKYYPWDEEIQKLLKKSCDGLFAFHGEPGGGKSSYIRYLAQTNPELDFYLCSMTTILAEGGIRYLGEFIKNRFSRNKRRKPKDIVIVLEDSEKLLMDRGNSGSSAIATSELLNIIDGTCSGRGHVKFIFTFNQKVSKIDPAMLRKGRLLKIIEFERFKGENLKKVSEEFKITLKPEELQKGLTIAEITHREDTGYESSKKLGF